MKPRNYHAIRRDSGVCVACGELPPEPNVVRCRSCIKAKRDRDDLYRQHVKRTVLNHYGPGCVLCPTTNLVFLTVDHIAGMGNQHRDSLNLQRGYQFYLWLRKQGLPNGYRTLCFNCNCRRKTTTAFVSKLKSAVLLAYGSGCACCGLDDPEALTIDHVDGGGNKHRRELGIGSGWRFYQWLRKVEFPAGYQTLCYNCNIGRALNGGVCPHST